MTDLTDFQEVAGLALDILDEQAAKIQPNWPQDERALRSAMKQWRLIVESTINGRELLAACTDIWKQRPADDELELVEGREILYHPIDGSPIPENSPLDGVSLDTLAFLRWAYKRGVLPWSDEVAIVREVLGVESDIDRLPSDRFYGRHSLPRTEGGAIDWTNLDLAAAKHFIRNGESCSVTPAKSPQGGYYIDDQSLEGVLCSIPALNSGMTRNQLLRGLPAGPTGTIGRSTAPSTDICNIVRAVEGFGKLTNGQRGIDVLIDNAIRFVQGTQLASELSKFKK